MKWITTPQSAGLYALSQGLSMNFADDHEMPRRGMVMYDALYSWLKSRQEEPSRTKPPGASPRKKKAHRSRLAL
jgi:hypothetical protein